MADITPHDMQNAWQMRSTSKKRNTSHKVYHTNANGGKKKGLGGSFWEDCFTQGTSKHAHGITHTCAGNGVDAVTEVLDDSARAALHSQDAGDLKDNICTRTATEAHEQCMPSYSTTYACPESIRNRARIVTARRNPAMKNWARRQVAKAHLPIQASHGTRTHITATAYP